MRLSGPLNVFFAYIVPEKFDIASGTRKIQ